MSFMRRIFARKSKKNTKQAWESSVDDELRFHLEQHTAQNIAAGMPPAEARRQAILRLGGIEALKEDCHDQRRGIWFETLWNDLRHGLRVLLKNPGFAAIAILTLALGIGANTAIFTLIQQVMLRQLPVNKPAQLWRLGDTDHCCFNDGYTQGDGVWLPQNDWNFFSWETYKLFRANTRAFDDLAAFQIGGNNAELAVRRADSPDPVNTGNGEYVSGNFFKTLGVSAWRGRLFTDADDQEGMPPVAVMCFRTWQTKYGSDPSVIGATYQMNGHAFTVIGIAQPGFFGAKIADSGMPDFWLPLTTEPLIAGQTSRLKNPRLAWLDLIGRARPGTNPKTLEAELRVELHQWLASHTADMTPAEKNLIDKQTLHLNPGGAGVSLLRNNYEQGLRLLMIAAFCVLLVACANIASLLLARALKNRPQTALRAALGASRARLIRKALAESLTLSLFGCLAGIAVAYAGAKLILSLAFTAPDSANPVSAAPSAPVLLFCLAISIVTGIVFGIAPAWMSSHADPIEALHGAARSVGMKRGVFAQAQKTLVIVQAAASLVLLSAAAMLGQSLRNLERQDFGFDTAGRYLVSVDPKISNYQPEQLATRFREIEDQLGSIPGVRSVGAVLEAPQSGWVPGHAIRIQGKPEPGENENVSSGWTRVTPGFFETLGDKILTGRCISEEDNANTQPVAVVNEAFAKKFFGNENPVGHHFGPVPPKNAGMYEIVGVASDVNFDGPEAIYFLPEAQTTHFDDPETEEREVWSHYLYHIVIWAPGNPPSLELQAKHAVAKIDPNLVLYNVQPYSDVIRGGFAQQTMIASVTWLFGGVGLVLAAVGLYGVTAYGVERRTSEIGVRIALGAGRANILRMVIGEGLSLVLIGIVAGIAGALALGRLLQNMLFGIKSSDPLTFATVAATLAIVALAACYIPARRAMRVDPVSAMRCE